MTGGGGGGVGLHKGSTHCATFTNKYVHSESNIKWEMATWPWHLGTPELEFSSSLWSSLKP